MSVSVQQRGTRWQLRVKHKLLPKPYIDTFDSEGEARTYGAQLKSLLVRGIVPAELAVSEKKPKDDPLLSKLIGDYDRAAPVAPTDRPLLALLRGSVATVALSSVTAVWADAWVQSMAKLAPGTIRKRVECLARVIDWHWRRMGVDMHNPLRSMPRGYSSVGDKRDTQRDRRLTQAEIESCRTAMLGVKRPDRERGLTPDPAFALMFELITATGMRLSEAYRLRVDQIDLKQWVIRVEGSKGHRGATKPRTVPIVLGLRPLLAVWCKGRVGLMFPFWNGNKDDLTRCTQRLSHRFRVLFDYAKVLNCTEHDLRHEATCRWFELRRKDGAWMYSDIEICKIMGWTKTSMALRYLSLRGEDLSLRLAE